MRRAFRQVDVFTTEPYRGNPVAVVLDGSGLETEEMQRLANWTNLSETTFLLPPADPAADYLARIFTPSSELPFAGHPTIGSCHAWLEAGGRPSRTGRVVQECGVGLVELREVGGRLAFAAPPLLRSGPVEHRIMEQALDALGLGYDEVVDAAWVDNGPGWMGIRVETVERLMAIQVEFVPLYLGVVAPHRDDADVQWEVRAFFPVEGAMREDPVTGSLNASLAQWMLGSGAASAPYVAGQGRALGRDGRVHVSCDGPDAIWIGGDAVTCIQGSVEL